MLNSLLCSFTSTCFLTTNTQNIGASRDLCTLLPLPGPYPIPIGPIICGHTYPIIGGHTYPITGGHTYPIISGHTYPIIGGHTYPIIDGHTHPIIGGHTHPIIGGHPLHRFLFTSRRSIWAGAVYGPL
jgi:hypothetical protein